MTCTRSGVNLPRLTGWCGCGHVFLAHGRDGSCAVCDLVTAASEFTERARRDLVLSVNGPLGTEPAKTVQDLIASGALPVDHVPGGIVDVDD